MNLYKGLLFLHGHFVRPEDLEEGARDTEASPPAAVVAPDATVTVSDKPSRLRACFSLLESLLFLGGRPMHPDRPYDREEAFEQLIDACIARAGCHARRSRA